VTWGLTFAEALKKDFPLLAEAAAMGLNYNPTVLLDILRDRQDAAASLQAVCAMIEAYIAHIVNTSNVEKEELLSQIRALRTDVEEKTSTVHSLAKSMENLSAPGQAPRNASSMARRISKDPEPFSGGEKDAACRQQQFIVWRSQINSCFAQDATVFDSERRKILHIASLLTGDAYELHRTYFDTITSNPAATDTWHWKMAVEVFRTLSGQFETMDLAQQASQKFDNLFMLNKPFQNFIAEFRALAQRCSKTETQKVEALKKKASKELADKLAYQPQPPAKDDFDAWCGLCQQLYNNEQEFKHFELLKSGRPSQHQPQPRQNLVPQNLAPTISTQDDGDPMQLDSARAAAKAAARAFCGENNLCFYCRKPGHVVANCEEKKAADTRFHQGNIPPTFRSRGGYSTPRGRGGFRQYPRAPPAQYQTPFLQLPQVAPMSQVQTYFGNNNPTAFNRLRALEQGLVDEETSSVASIPPVNTPETDQRSGKD
jgi:hypothetical protein